MRNPRNLWEREAIQHCLRWQLPAIHHAARAAAAVETRTRPSCILLLVVVGGFW